jgi:CRP-like cAMP-binding protein
VVFGLRATELNTLTKEMPSIKESLLQILSYRLKQNLLSIPFFAKLQKQLEKKKEFKMMGAFDLLSTLFELESVPGKHNVFSFGDAADKFYVICEGCVRISSTDGDGNDVMLSMLKKNDVFGEIALLEHTKRTATARAFEPVLMLSITKAKFDRLFEVFPEFETALKPFVSHRTANTLKKVKAFTKLTKDKMETLGGLMEFRDYPKDSVIEKEGKYSASLYVIVSGSVRAVTMHQGKETLLSTTEGGGVLGEMALLTGTARSATLIAAVNTQCLCLPVDKFRRFLPFAPELMDDLVSLSQIRRSRSVEVNAETALAIPDIDQDIDNKLYLYSLLRNHHDTVLFRSVGEMAGGNTVEALVSENEEMRILNQRKRGRIDELKNRMRQLTNQIEHGGLGAMDLALSLESGLLKDQEEKKREEGDGEELKSKGQHGKLQRRNSWTSNTQYEQHKEDIVRILRETFQKRLETRKNDGDLSEALERNNRKVASDRGGLRSLGNSPKISPKIRKRQLSLRQQRGAESVAGGIDIDIGDYRGNTQSPSKALGQHFDQFSAAASTRHIVEEGEESPRRGSRSNSRNNSRKGTPNNSRPNSQERRSSGRSSGRE